MDDRDAEAAARGRWMVINAVRISGIVMMLLGIFVIQGVIGLPEAAGYVLLGAGLIDIFLVPAFLARKWRSRR